MEFVEGKIAEEKVFGDVVFPKTLNPPCMEGNGVNELVEMVRGKLEWLYEVLQRHSAILFRGFNVSSPEDFNRVVEAFGWDNMSFMGPTSRLKVIDGVYTANEAPLDQLLNFHHEMSLIKQFPSKIIFFCSEPPPEGGETSIVPSHIIVEKMEERVPEFVTKLSNLGYVYRLRTAKQDNPSAIFSKTWKWFFDTEDEVEAEKRAKERLPISSINFNEDGTAEFVYGPTNPIREFAGKRVWFNTLVGFTANIDQDIKNSFGDGTPFPSTAMETYQNVIDQNCVNVKWQRGDVLVVDNLSVQHARRPGKPPRVILVSICK